MPFPEVTRRGFLGLAGGVGLATVGSRLVRGPSLLTARSPQTLGGQPFALGVASGDPLSDRVVLWTRLAPDPTAPAGGMPPEVFPVRWEVATDERFGDVVAGGTVRAKPDTAHSVHVDASGLEPATDYFYRFIADGTESDVGRTRTAPAAGRLARLRFAFASCQDYEEGYYGAHRHLADDDVDVVFWLGDYIYEGGVGSNGVRRHEGPEILDLDAYRRRYATYKSDIDLQRSHVAHPWVVTWDDHEVDNNYADDRSQRDDQAPDAFLQRRAVAYQAWWEHQPVRLSPPTGPDYKIYRRVSFGDLVNFHVLDTRQYRTDQPCGSPVDIGTPCAGQDAPDATLLGSEQREWLFTGLRESTARWDVLAQQIMFGPVSFSPDPALPVLNLDQWDGYEVERQKVLKALTQAPRNGVVITGDIHSSWVNDLVTDVSDETGAAPRTVATELVGTSITSNFPFADVIDAAVPTQPTIKYGDGRHHGYVRCDLTRNQLRADFRYVSSIETPDVSVETGASFVIGDRKPGALAV
ncbi:MAG: alkaline phosphatase D family protein [Acidimicrobiia bacterium]